MTRSLNRMIIEISRQSFFVHVEIEAKITVASRAPENKRNGAVKLRENVCIRRATVGSQWEGFHTFRLQQSGVVVKPHTRKWNSELNKNSTSACSK